MVWTFLRVEKTEGFRSIDSKANEQWKSITKEN